MKQVTTTHAIIPLSSSSSTSLQSFYASFFILLRYFSLDYKIDVFYFSFAATCLPLFFLTRQETNKPSENTSRVETFTLCSPSFFLVQCVLHMQISWIWIHCLCLAKCLAHFYLLFLNFTNDDTNKTRRLFSVHIPSNLNTRRDLPVAEHFFAFLVTSKQPLSQFLQEA